MKKVTRMRFTKNPPPPESQRFYAVVHVVRPVEAGCSPLDDFTNSLTASGFQVPDSDYASLVVAVVDTVEATSSSQAIRFLTEKLTSRGFTLSPNGPVIAIRA